MLKKRFTYKCAFKRYKNYERVPSIRLDNVNTTFIGEPEGSEVLEYIVGEVADRLYEYEELGYTPEELRVIVEKYNKEIDVHSGRYPWGSKNTDEGYYIDRIIDQAMKAQDKNTNIFFGPAGISVHVSPCNKEETEEENS